MIGMVTTSKSTGRCKGRNITAEMLNSDVVSKNADSKNLLTGRGKGQRESDIMSQFDSK